MRTSRVVPVRRRMRVLLAVPMVATLTLSVPVSGQIAQERVDLSAVSRIRDEGLNHSQIPELAHHLTDVIGPRLTGSPGMKAANDWTAAMLRSWGLSGVAIAPWGRFGRGWENISYQALILTPYSQVMPGQPSAWTGSTKGSVTAPLGTTSPCTWLTRHYLTVRCEDERLVADVLPAAPKPAPRRDRHATQPPRAQHSSGPVVRRLHPRRTG